VAAQLRHVHEHPRRGVVYTTTRLIILGIAVGIGVLLWLWLKRTPHRHGDPRRAVDDRAMVSALGINIQLTVAIAFVVVLGARRHRRHHRRLVASLAPGVDANWRSIRSS